MEAVFDPHDLHLGPLADLIPCGWPVDTSFEGAIASACTLRG